MYLLSKLFCAGRGEFWFKVVALQDCVEMTSLVNIICPLSDESAKDMSSHNPKDQQNPGSCVAHSSLATIIVHFLINVGNLVLITKKVQLLLGEAFLIFSEVNLSEFNEA